MIKISKNSQINQLVNEKIKQGWRVENRKKHPLLIAPNNRRIAIPRSPSDHKAFFSFSNQVKYLEIDLNSTSN